MSSCLGLLHTGKSTSICASSSQLQSTRSSQVLGKKLIAGPFADHAMHLAQVLAHLLQRKAEREEAFGGLAGHAAGQAFVADLVEGIGMGPERGLDRVDRRRQG